MKRGKKVLAFICVTIAMQSANAQTTTTSNSLTGSLASPNEYLGSYNQYPVIFKMNNSERMRIATDGAIGIGTSTPGRALHVQTGQTNGGLRVTQTTNGFSSLELFNLTSGGHNWTLASTGSANGEGAGHFELYDYTSSEYRFFINGTTGFTGIGTTSPQEKLDVAGNLNVRGKLKMQVPASSQPIAGLSIDVTSFATVANAANSFYFRVQDIGAAYTPFMVRGDGAVCVGGTRVASGAKLSVNGQMYAEQVNVQLNANWPDYVFSKQYQLAPLSEIDQYIQENSHLPGIPSAFELKEKGLDVADMQTKQMQKIEELTLYIIEQQKLIDAMQKSMVELKNKIEGR